MITERAIINFLMWIGGLILGSYVATSAAGGNTVPLLISFGLLFPALTFYARERLSVFPLLGGYIAGKFRFVPSGIAAADLGAMALILYFLVDYIVIRHKPIRLGPASFFVPILALFLIVLYHDHSFGLHALGGAMEGSRAGVLILMAGVTYVCGINVSTPSPSFLKNLPWYALALVTLSAIPYELSVFFPSLTPYIYIITDNVDVRTYLNADSYSDGTTGIARNGCLAGVGGTLMLCLLCYYPITTWWRPGRWHLVILAFACFVMNLSGGFRNGMVSFGLSVILGMWCYLTWRTLILIPAIAIGLLLVAFNQDYHVIELPLTAQRSLSFLPLNWDPEVQSAAETSNDFRDNIKQVYFKEYLYKSPWFGNGISFDAAKFDQLSVLAATRETRDHYYQAEVFITGKMFHTGWLSLYDIVGLVGSAFFIFLNLSMTWVSGRMVFGRGVDRRSPLFPLKAWMFVNCVSPFFGFFTMFGDFKTAFPALCYTAIVLAHLDKLERTSKQDSSLPPQRPTVQISNPRPSLIGGYSRGKG